MKLPKYPNDIHCRINVARNLAEKLEDKICYPDYVDGIRVGISSYLLWSSLDHLLWWAALESQNILADKVMRSRIRFGSAINKVWLKECEKKLMMHTYGEF